MYLFYNAPTFFRIDAVWNDPFSAIYLDMKKKGSHFAKSNLIFLNDAAEVYYYKLSSGIRNFKFLPNEIDLFIFM